MPHLASATATSSCQKMLHGHLRCPPRPPIAMLMASRGPCVLWQSFFPFRTSPLLFLHIDIRGMGGCHLDFVFLSYCLVCLFLWQHIFRQQYAGPTCFPLLYCCPLRPLLSASSLWSIVPCHRLTIKHDYTECPDSPHPSLGFKIHHSDCCHVVFVVRSPPQKPKQTKM